MRYLLASNVRLPRGIRQLKEKYMPEQPNRREPAQSQSSDSNVMDATRHVGPTLESEGNFANVTGTALPIANRESDNSAETTPDSVEVRTVAQDRGDTPDPSTEGLVSSTTPPLRTRLPGDTSSDPHTDLGSDNASTVQNRPGGKERDAA
jgi:hypothetical protein